MRRRFVERMLSKSNKGEIVKKDAPKEENCTEEEQHKKSAPGEAVDGVPSEAAEGAPCEAVDGVPSEAAEGVSGEAVDGAPDEAGDVVPSEAADVVPDEAVDGAPDKDEEQGSKELKEDIFDDTDVCQYLGTRRRTLWAERKKSMRGKDWDCRGSHAGMTRSWVARRKGVSGSEVKLKPVEDGDGITTVKVIAKAPNMQVMLCEKMSTEEVVPVRTRDSRMFHIGDQIDCVEEMGRLRYDANLNREKV